VAVPVVVAAAPRRGSPVARSVKDAFAAFAAVRRTEKAARMYLRLYYTTEVGRSLAWHVNSAREMEDAHANVSVVIGPRSEAGDKSPKNYWRTSRMVNAFLGTRHKLTL